MLHKPIERLPLLVLMNKLQGWDIDYAKDLPKACVTRRYHRLSAMTHERTVYSADTEKRV